MAVRRDLTSARRLAVPLAVLAAGVLLAHALLLSWLGRALPEPSALKAMADPMFTRLLAPAPAPALVAAVPPPVAAAAAAPRAAKPASAASAAREAHADAEAASPQPPAQALAPAPESVPVAPAVTSAEAAAAPASLSPSSPAASAPTASTPPPPAPPDTWPTDTRLTYLLGGQFRGGPLYGDARVQWQRQGPLYQAQVHVGVQLAGSFSMTSQGEVTPAGLVPRAYEEQRRSRRRAVRLTDTTVVLADGQSVPRPAQVQDAASQFVELGHRFATGQQPLVLGGTVDLWLARPGGVDKWTYDVAAQDLLRTPRHGEVMAWRLTPRPLDKPRGPITAEMWFAPSLQYLPVRIRLSLGEEAQIDLMVDTIEQR